MYEIGLREYVLDLWNLADIFTNTCFVGWIVLRITAYIIVKREEALGINPYTKREHWNAYDPFLISEGLFGAGMISSYLKLVHIFSINPHLGPLQVSTLKNKILPYLRKGQMMSPNNCPLMKVLLITSPHLIVSVFLDNDVKHVPSSSINNFSFPLDIPRENGGGYYEIFGVIYIGTLCIWLWIESITVVLRGFRMA